MFLLKNKWSIYLYTNIIVYLLYKRYLFFSAKEKQTLLIDYTIIMDPERLVDINNLKRF